MGDSSGAEPDSPSQNDGKRHIEPAYIDGLAKYPLNRSATTF